jgi:hypothetical protein
MVLLARAGRRDVRRRQNLPAPLRAAGLYAPFSLKAISDHGEINARRDG